MALTTVQTVTLTGLNPSYATPSATEQVQPVERQFLHVKNGSGSSMNVTVTDPGNTPAGSSAQSPVIAVPAGAERMIYLPTSLMSPVTGTIQVAFSATASVTAALLRS